MAPDHVLFSEEQRFRQRWLWVLLIVAVAPIPPVFWYGVLRQVVGGHPWGSRPMSDAGLLTLAVLDTLFTVGLLALYWTARLVTIVQSDGLLVRFRPFHLRPRRIDLSDVVSVEAVTYSPLRQYGGWGIRFGLGGRAYNVSGNRGVRLTRRSGRRLLIGSQRPDELAAAVRRVWDATNRGAT